MGKKLKNRDEVSVVRKIEVKGIRGITGREGGGRGAPGEKEEET